MCFMLSNISVILVLYWVEFIIITPPSLFKGVMITLLFMKNLLMQLFIKLWSLVLKCDCLKCVKVICPCLNPFTKSESLSIYIINNTERLLNLASFLIIKQSKACFYDLSPYLAKLVLNSYNIPYINYFYFH